MNPSLALGRQPATPQRSATSGARSPARHRSGWGRASFLADGANELRLAHLGATVDIEPRRLATQFLHCHRTCPASGALGGAALAGGGLGSLATERRLRLARELGDRFLVAGVALRLLDVLACCLALLFGCHEGRLPMMLSRNHAAVRSRSVSAMS